MIINAAIQVVPLTPITQAFAVVDEAIAIIQRSGISYTVGPLDTVLEGEYEAVNEVIKQLHDFCNSQPEIQFLIYTKMHLCGGKNILAEDKTAKFR